MDKNVARILRYAQEQLITVEGLKAASPEVTKGTGRAIAAIHNALWLLESDQVKGPVLRKRLLPHPVQWSEMDDDVVVQDSVVAMKYKEAFGSPSTPPQVDPPGGWTPEAVDQAAFKPQVTPDNAIDTEDAIEPEPVQSVAIKPLSFYLTLLHGDTINEANELGFIFQYKGSRPALWRFGVANDIKKLGIPWIQCGDAVEAINACNAKWQEILSKYVAVEKPKPSFSPSPRLVLLVALGKRSEKQLSELRLPVLTGDEFDDAELRDARELIADECFDLPRQVIRWIALGKNAEDVVANGHDFQKKDIDRVDSEFEFYADQALFAVSACLEKSNDQRREHS